MSLIHEAYMVQEILILVYNRPGDLLVAPLWPIGTAVLQSLQHQQVALSVAQQQFSICTTSGIQQTLNSLEREKWEKNEKPSN